jgi:hypothetical protein
MHYEKIFLAEGKFFGDKIVGGIKYMYNLGLI